MVRLYAHHLIALLHPAIYARPAALAVHGRSGCLPLCHRRPDWPNLCLPRLLLGPPDPAPSDRHHRPRNLPLHPFHYLLSDRGAMSGDSYANEWGEIGVGEGFLGFSEGVGFDGGGVTGECVLVAECVIQQKLLEIVSKVTLSVGKFCFTIYIECLFELVGKIKLAERYT